MIHQLVAVPFLDALQMGSALGLVIGAAWGVAIWAAAQAGAKDKKDKPRLADVEVVIRF